VTHAVRNFIALVALGSGIPGGALLLLDCGSNSQAPGPAWCTGTDCAAGAAASPSSSAADGAFVGTPGSPQGSASSGGASPMQSATQPTMKGPSQSPSDAGALPQTQTDSSAGSTSTGANSMGCGAATWPASGTFTIDVSGTQRQYIVTLPNSYAPSTPYKLVFAWHGLGGTAQQIAGQGFGGFGGSFAYYGLQALANDTVIFVAGQGLGTQSDGGGAGWPNANGQDVAFTKAMLQWMQSNYCIDSKHIFSVGMSYGGIMSDTLGCQMGDVFRAVTPMSGSGPNTFFGAPSCVGEVAVWMSHGEQDTTVPFEAGVASRDYWRKANHCGDQTMAVGPGTCVEYQGCDPGYPVDWCEFDGGHTIPSFAANGIWMFLSRF
jgi:polyhydroxybutyrate depolymerase